MGAKRQKLVLIGNGMAGVNTLEHILKLSPEQYDITVFGSEPHPNYNRIMLSYVLEGSKTMDDIILNSWFWYEEHRITLHTGTTITAIDTQQKIVTADNGLTAAYDRLIMATGSNPIILPVPGHQKQGVVGFRDIADCSVMLEAAKQYRNAAVIGGGLLGLEAAKGLLNLGMNVTVIHLMADLMERQLDPSASAMLKAELERQGLHFLMEKQTAEIYGGERVEGLTFSDGTKLESDFIVMAAGIRPNTALASASGIEVKRGIVVDDYMQTSADGVYAVGECAEHRGVCYGLVAPLFEQGAVLAKQLCGVQTKPYEGTQLSTKLKISGVDVFSTGVFLDQPELTVIRKQDDWKQQYKKLLLKDDTIVGGVLYGDVSDSSRIQQWVREGTAMTEAIYAELMGAGGTVLSAADRVAQMADDEIVCGCNGVSKGSIIKAIKDNSLTSVDEVKACTGAGRSCGGCVPTVSHLLQYVLGDEYAGQKTKTGICGCTDLSRDEIVAAIKEKHLTTVKEVMHVLQWHNPEGCSKCRPAVNYYLGMLWPQEHEDEKDSRFVNERMNANIQKDGTYTVVPRMYGGVTTPEDLKKIADVAVKYDVKMVKVTGGQRLDLIGVAKEDLPLVWEELDMPSGYAYAKALRTVKTCVGQQFCRFGTQDSIGMGIRLEKTFERIDMPAKFKMAVNGCPRNCAESCTKDIGIVGNDGGWEMFVGGNGGIKPRIAELLCKVKTDEELVQMVGAFTQYYRLTANYLERTSEWVERIGIEAIKAEVVDNMDRRRELYQDILAVLAELKEPWSTALEEQRESSYLFDAIQMK
ncbi:nitrite reductase (NADH) large subunit [Paenibacillus algorifonticola]|uniref:Nitrite reductase (NADH) large subunit n=1 Tax=Paenibacillus algorifonticola TaxID=684063 RepID=A0A1I2HBM9_9BACL|nr:nitrite reductase large subunit NirB [Paenibacillus algorifonticola]SFF27584.1 nitrite reductase (NADH) large subunit [Paenibacillus algorifonticola]